MITFEAGMGEKYKPKDGQALTLGCSLSSFGITQQPRPVLNLSNSFVGLFQQNYAASLKFTGILSNVACPPESGSARTKNEIRRFGAR